VSRPSGVALDDLIDAMAACWTAERVLKNEEIRLPVRHGGIREGFGWRSFGRKTRAFEDAGRNEPSTAKRLAECLYGLERCGPIEK